MQLLLRGYACASCSDRSGVISPCATMHTRCMARLMVVCALKRDFSIAELSYMMEFELAQFENRLLYNMYCDEMERTIRHVFLGETIAPAGPSSQEAIMRAVMTAFANKLYAHCIIRDNKAREGSEPLALPGVNNA